MTLSIKFKKSKCKQEGGLMKCEVDPTGTPDHQDFVKGKKLDLKVVEDEEAAADSWD